ncbi:MAG: hypothetical protein JW775_08175 [Candidatus Aminicenantes bacterium]|nr:hypothetical protein [Candidatus Aminicenantes bacterium]
MKAKIALFVFAAVFLVHGPLAASEAVWDLVVPTGLQPSAFVLPDPLPEPALTLMAPPAIEPARELARRLVAPPRLPGLGPRPGSGKALFEANLVLMVGLNIADYLSTREALKYPGLTEVNPLMKPFVKSPAAFAAVKFGTTALSYVSMKAIFKRNKTVAWVMTTASNALLSYVVANNMRLIQGARAR